MPERPRLDVLYVINGLGTGGAERSLADLLDPLEKRGIDISVACLHPRGEGVEREVRAKHDVAIVGPGLWRSFRGIRSLIEAKTPDLIHTTIFESDIVGRLASIGTNTPVVTSIVNTTYALRGGDHPDVSQMKLEMARIIDGFTARHVNVGFHALTEESASAATEALKVPRDMITVIHRGRDPARLGASTPVRRHKARSSLQIDADQRILLSVGRREHQKGQIHAIEALAALREESPKAVLLIAGREGAASTRLSETAERLGLMDAVAFLGHRDDVPDLMVAADVLVFPSLYEGFGGTLIEAMALDLPIVAWDIPVVREVVGGCALLADQGSSHEFANAVRRILTDSSLRSQLTEAGRQRFQERFTIDRIATQMADLYRMHRSR